MWRYTDVWECEIGNYWSKGNRFREIILWYKRFWIILLKLNESGQVNLYLGHLNLRCVCVCGGCTQIPFHNTTTTGVSWQTPDRIQGYPQDMTALSSTTRLYFVVDVSPLIRLKTILALYWEQVGLYPLPMSLFLFKRFSCAERQTESV